MPIDPGQLERWLFEYKLNGIVHFPGLIPVSYTHLTLPTILRV